jgi:2-oxoglutarate dehydrogenase E1 component
VSGRRELDRDGRRIVGRAAEVGPLNVGFAERMMRRCAANGRTHPSGWQRLLEAVEGTAPRLPPDGRGRRSIFDPAPALAPTDEVLLQERVERMAEAFLDRGHEAADTDPLADPAPTPRDLTPEAYGIHASDLGRGLPIRLGGVAARRTVRGVLRELRESYCGTLAVDAMHVRSREVRRWLRSRMETRDARRRPSRVERLALYERLADAQAFEELVRARFVGARSYSMEGAESLLPLLDAVVDAAAEEGAAEIVLAMAHRGRLNVLANLFERSPAALFRELDDDGDGDAVETSGDVRYHLGASVDRRSASGRDVHLSLCFNPSHLGFVAPIALGRTRAKQDRTGDAARTRGIAVCVHGDAAFAGEGVVQETLNLDGLAAYDVGGALHVVLDNRIGFTTGPEQGRSTRYATDAARMLDAPILHVNGDDPEAVLRAARLAMDFRRSFRRSVVLGLRCYRRHGHNELDEPRMTQPLLYARIDARPAVRDAYGARLVRDGDLEEVEARRMAEARRARLDAELEEAEERGPAPRPDAGPPAGVWAGFRGGPAAERDAPETGLPVERCAALLEALATVPDDLRVHPKVAGMLAQRRAMARGERPLNWSTAEALALASLAADGVPVRLAGQDTERGTFSQRHATLVDQETAARYVPLQHVHPDQAPVEVINTPLSEAGALGFEYGYSLDRPEGLVLWEAQFGDFANAAQVVIDQFIASAEDKWRRLSGIVLLLPHGFEGLGPEHSSARLERFLTAAAEDNLQIAQPSTPAQMFHVLRRQALQRWRKPLVLMTPKSLLRHRRCVSALAACAQGRFAPVLGAIARPEELARVLLCSGKIAYELERRRDEEKRDDVAIVRIEELYPFPGGALADVLAPVPDGTPLVWVQEEPENMGAWRAVRGRLSAHLGGRLPLTGVTRAASASPASGSSSRHAREREELLLQAFEEDRA